MFTENVKQVLIKYGPFSSSGLANPPHTPPCPPPLLESLTVRRLFTNFRGRGLHYNYFIMYFFYFLFYFLQYKIFCTVRPWLSLLAELYTTPPSILTLVTWVPQSRLSFSHASRRLAIGPPALGQTESYRVKTRLPLAATVGPADRSRVFFDRVRPAA